VRLDDARGFVFDIDGTLVHRGRGEIHVQPGAVDVLRRILDSGRRFVLFTNGSHFAPEAFAAELRGCGLPVDDDDVLTPLCSVNSYLRTRYRDPAVLTFATDAAREYLLRTGIRLVDGAEPVEVVFVAHPPVADFAELERAARAVLGGARLLTASYAPAYAGADGPILSRGAMVAAAIAKVSSTRPVVVGKPSRAAVRTIEERLGVANEDLVVVGDDATMDVALGRLAGARTILVRTGTSGNVAPEALAASRRPDAIVDGVAELLRAL
jgi:HAD superfamily hydrolase (TIGR01450 family)